jgi:hypothetical protein
MKRAVVLAALLCASVSVSLQAQDPVPAPAAPSAAQASTPAPQAPPPAPPHGAHDQAGATREYPSLRISGFGDVNFSATHLPEGPRGFSLGQLALHMIAELSPRVTFFGELSFSARPDAGQGSPPVTGFNTEVERMIIRFDRSDQLKVSFGRYHTPINWWNTAYHHGQWLQTSIARPEMTQFGGRFLPVHFVGALVEGGVPAGGWNLNYKAGVGNGRGQVISRAGDAGDLNGNRAWLANLYSKPDAAYGLEFGGAVYGDTVTLADAREFDEHIVAGHVVWNKENPEVIAEFAGVRHVQAGTTTVNWSRAFYVQVAYRLPWQERLWKPYFRFEHVGIADADAMFATVPELDGSTAGIRYDLSQYAAIKGEFRTWRRGTGTPRNRGGFIQICFTF